MTKRITPVAVRLSEVKMLAGGEFKLVMANLAFAGVTLVMLHIWQYVPVALLLHGILVLAARRDPRLREIYLGYSMQGDRYVPWPSPTRQRLNRRPYGFAREEVC